MYPTFALQNCEWTNPPATQETRLGEGFGRDFEKIRKEQDERRVGAMSKIFTPQSCVQNVCNVAVCVARWSR